ncbi:MAG: low affinity iron permease family protein, partial [Chthoniobacterales bacterium]
MVIKTNGSNSKQKEESRGFFGRVRDAFGIFARKTSNVLGSAWAFVIALAVIVVWALTGP